MQTRVQQWGQGLAIRIPGSLAEETHIEQDSLVDIVLENGKLVISPVRVHDTLQQLLDQVTEENRHEEQDFGVPEGREVW